MTATISTGAGLRSRHRACSNRQPERSQIFRHHSLQSFHSLSSNLLTMRTNLPQVPGSLIDRRIADVVQARLREVPVVALQGPRSVGKSTLLNQMAAQIGASVVNLDHPRTRQAVTDDPSAFVEHPHPVFVDEFQKAPGILDAIKASLGEDYRPGRFVLTGSTRFDALPVAAQSLTGRIHFETILPFSQGELNGTHEDFFDVALTEPNRFPRGLEEGLRREDYAERICRGGMPPAVEMTATARQKWLSTYASVSVRRDVADLSRVRRSAALLPLLNRLAGQTAQVLNVSAAGRAVNLDPATAGSYVTLLEDLFLVRRLPAWGRTLRARAAAHPKIHVVDSGVAARLMRITPDKLTMLDPASLTEFGHLFETFVVGELLKQASWSELAHPDDIGHWRTHDGHEVDLVVESIDGHVTGFEVKASRQVHANDLRGLIALRDTLGAQFHAGIVITTGDTSYRADDKIYVVPAHRLWQPTPAPKPRKRIR